LTGSCRLLLRGPGFGGTTGMPTRLANSVPVTIPRTVSSQGMSGADYVLAQLLY
jgi:hypothetical protein